MGYHSHENRQANFAILSNKCGVIMKKDWLNYFKLAVTQARDARLSGDIERACILDKTIEDYYSERKTLAYFSEGKLCEIESDIRNN